tara:strand:- start:1634 stop:1789 length:156 start_codon:yes stop_codon:yes gene_type:complete
MAQPPPPIKRVKQQNTNNVLNTTKNIKQTTTNNTINKRTANKQQHNIFSKP